MKSLIIFVTVIVAASCQIYTKLQEDGYHYDRPQNRLEIPEAKPQGKATTAAFPTPPPPPSFLPKINLPSVIPVKPTQPPAKAFEPSPTLPPLPSFLPKINLPSVIPVKPTTQAPAKTIEAIPTLPPLPAFLPKINLPSVIPVKPTTAPAAKRPIPPFPPIINLPSVIPVKPTQAPVTPKAVAVSQPAPFVPQKPLPVKPVTPKIEQRIVATTSKNEYLPPVEPQEDEWEAWKKKYNKRYDSQAEDDKRRVIFYDNARVIDLHNADFAAGLVTFDMEKNKYCDLTSDEFVKIHTGIRGKKRSTQDDGYDYPVPSPGFITEDDFRSDFKSTSFASASNGTHSSFQSSSISSQQPSGFRPPSGPPPLPSGFKLPSSGLPSVLPISPSGFKPSSSSLPVSPSSSLPVSPSSSKGQKDMTNVFMPSESLEGATEDEVDWRKKGAITPVKNQGKCASCWAFAANGALEAHNFLRKGTGPTPLSEQNLIDCVTDNEGCDGGYPENAFYWVKKNKGVDTEASYPYEERDGQKCRFERANVGGMSNGHMEIMIGNEEALRQAVATVGPVAAGIDGAKKSFQFYKSGYYYEPTCEQDVNHAVVIVGYGKTDKGEEYWICKNSWDTDWGEAGYVRMAKNKKNHCGIANLASYPIV